MPKDERIVNLGFFVVAFFVILAAYGVNIHDLFLLLSSIIVSFAFMIGKSIPLRVLA
jgi:hypothetical protein